MMQCNREAVVGLDDMHLCPLCGHLVLVHKDYYCEECRELVRQAKAKTGICQVRKHPRGFEPVETEIHHILPKAMGGTNALSNLIETCALCHDNIHAIMWRMSVGKPIPAGHRAEKKLAKRALDEWSGTGEVPRGGTSNIYRGSSNGDAT